MLFWGPFASVMVMDLLTKTWVRHNLALGESRFLLGSFLRFTHWTNTGASFGLLEGSAPLLAALSAICILVAIAGYPKLTGAGRVYPFTLGLIAGGALGNLWDRIRYGAVTDFISFHFFAPIFNVADCAIVIGAGILIIALVRSPKGKFGENW